ncbi:AP-4 complex subunit beta-1-like [Tubulanus polymorphus]|uniref:AP-4 complex subunit beta-1-like n=1 Tax=Tubulanus polymorphus TaxID=672921 RepID=UPI003DA43B8A
MQSKGDVNVSAQELEGLLKQALSPKLSHNEIEALFPTIVKLIAHNDLRVKKFACLFVSSYGGVAPQTLLLAINTLVKDCSDPNPTVRGLALRTICALRDDSFSDYVSHAVVAGLKDRSAYVRRIAVSNCVSVARSNASFLVECGIVDELYAMIRDTDPIVVVNCLHTLDELLRPEGGIVVNKNIAYSLLNRVSSFSEWGVIRVFDVLKRYETKDENEVFDILNILDKYLNHFNASVVRATVELFLRLVAEMPHLQVDIFKRSHRALVSFLGSDNRELVYAVLEYIDRMVLAPSTTSDSGDVGSPRAVDLEATSFYCKAHEPTYVKTKKIAMLPKIATDENVTEIVEELSMYSLDINVDVSVAAVAALGKIAVARQNKDCYDVCVEKLLKMLELRSSSLSSNVLCVLKSIPLADAALVKRLVSRLRECASYVEDGGGKSALLYLLGEHGGEFDDGAYVIDDFVNGDDDSLDNEVAKVKFSVLHSAMKLFFAQPAQCQDALGKLFEMCLSDSNTVDLEERAKLYYNMLRIDPIEARRVICNNECQT